MKGHSAFYTAWKYLSRIWLEYFMVKDLANIKKALQTF